MSRMNVVMFVFQMELEWVPTVIMLFRNLIPYDDLGTNKKKMKNVNMIYFEYNI